MTAALSLEALEALPVGSVVEDTHQDRAVREDTGLWVFPETAPLTTHYIHKHYSPITLISRKDDAPMTLDSRATDEVSVPPLALPAEVETVEGALEVIQSLRIHFGLSGTEFTPDDIQGQIETTMSGMDEEFVSLLAPALTAVVQEDRRWARLSDYFAENGNMVVGDIVSETVGLLDSEPLSESTVFVITATNAHGTLIRESEVRASKHVPGEVARAKAEAGVTKVCVAVREGTDVMNSHEV